MREGLEEARKNEDEGESVPNRSLRRQIERDRLGTSRRGGAFQHRR